MWQAGQTQRVDLPVVTSRADTKARFTCCSKQGWHKVVDVPVVENRADIKGRFTCCGKQG